MGGLFIITKISCLFAFYQIDYVIQNNSSLRLIRKYGLDDNTTDFIGHAIALHLDDNYLNQPALDFVKRMKVFSSFDDFVFVF